MTGRIDTHHHPYPPKYVAEVAEQLRTVTHRHFEHIQKWTPAQAIDALDQGGIATAILSMSAPGVWFGDITQTRRMARDSNDYMATLARDHKARFGVFAALPLPDVDASLREIEYALDTLKVDGFGLVTNYGDKWPGDKAFAPVFDELNRRKAVVYFHPTAAPAFEGILPNIPSPMIEFPSDTTRAIVSVLFSGTLSRCPDVKYIFSHAGGTLPMLAGRIDGIARNRKDLAAMTPNGVMHEIRRLHYDIAGVTHPIAFNAAYQLVGASQLLFGTDYPFWDPNLASTTLATLVPDAAECRAIERDNALKLMPRLDTAANA
jgi:predicted TIM-barrel fold metal-dependent hydrolase